jgi:hypothetical protein
VPATDTLAFALTIADSVELLDVDDSPELLDSDDSSELLDVEPTSEPEPESEPDAHTDNADAIIMPAAKVVASILLSFAFFI